MLNKLALPHYVPLVLWFCEKMFSFSFVYFFAFISILVYFSIVNNSCRGSELSTDPRGRVGDIHYDCCLFGSSLLFPQEKRGDSIFPPYMAAVLLC